MQKHMKRNALIAGSAFALAGAVTAVTLSTGGQHARASSGTAGAVGAQRVDVTDPSAAPVPSTGSSAQKVINLRVRNDVVGIPDFETPVCINNSTIGVSCTGGSVKVNEQDEMDGVVIGPDQAFANVITGITPNPVPSIQFSIQPGQTLNKCVRLVSRNATDGTSGKPEVAMVSDDSCAPGGPPKR